MAEHACEPAFASAFKDIKASLLKHVPYIVYPDQIKTIDIQFTKQPETLDYREFHPMGARFFIIYGISIRATLTDGREVKEIHDQKIDGAVMFTYSKKPAVGLSCELSNLWVDIPTLVEAQTGKRYNEHAEDYHLTGKVWTTPQI